MNLTMADQPSDEQDRHPPPPDREADEGDEFRHRTLVAIKRAHELGRTVRWLIVAGAICLGLWVIADAIVKILDRPVLYWILIAIGSGILSALGIAGYTVGRFKRYMRTHNKRLKQFEEAQDPHRTSSGLEEDGTISKDDPL
jgi:hypothetical protein